VIGPRDAPIGPAAPEAGSAALEVPNASVEPSTPPDPDPGTIAAPPPVPDAIRELPLSGRRIVPIALDLLLRAEPRLRAASFYVGFLLAATAPAVALFGGGALVLGDALFDPFTTPGEWSAWLGLAALVAVPGFFVAAVESRILATAVIAAAIEGRPLAMGGLLALSRRRFWTAARAAFLVGIVVVIGQTVGQTLTAGIADDYGEIAFGASLLGGVVLSTPFVYAFAGVVVGEVGALEGIRRSWRLFRARPRLAVVVTVFSLVTQFVLLFAFSAGTDVAVRVLDVLGIGGDIPLVAAVAAAIVMVFGLGTLLFLAEAIAATPAVHAFVALTYYTHGLEAGRRPEDEARGRRAWLTRPLIVGVLVGFGSLAMGLAALGA
jgi:hypothetical protein